MDDKERLEEIKKHRNEADNCIDEYEFEKINFYNLHVDWLIKQAERVQELEEENNQLNNEMEGLFQKLEDREPYYSMKCLGLEEQNERYREALELLVKNETLGKDIKTGKIAISYNGMIALKGLGIFNDNDYIVYGADEIIESVLDGHK